jgi:hypothetical protein
MLNPKWQRYIAASINKHFVDNLTDPTYNVFVEGQHRTNVDFQKIIDIRFDGPYWHELHHNNWKGVVEINNLVSFKMDDSDNYKIWDIIGDVTNTMSKSIEIFNYDNPPISLLSLGCLQRMDNRDDIIVHYFGQVEPNLKLQQATCEAHYFIDLIGI